MTKMADTNTYNFRVARSNAEAESHDYKQTPEQRQAQLSADIAAYLANGGIITEVPSDDSH